MTIALLAAVCFLAYANGANDNFKGVASLFGSQTTSYRTALGWATISTFAGSLAAILLAQALLQRFSGKGLVPDSLAGSERFLLAIAVGAGITVILATVTGFPVSTTHALAGGMMGGGWVAVGWEVNLHVLGWTFFLPLLLSPVLAGALAAGLYLMFRFVRLRLGITKEWCLCVGDEQRVLPVPQPSSVLQLQTTMPGFSACAGEPAQCAERYAGQFWGINCQQVMDVAHFLSAGVVSFARGLNDTPKIAALLLLFPMLGTRWSLVCVAVVIALGGLLSAARVAESLSHKITSMNHGQGYSANLATGLLVIAASLFGWPVSTTHVSVGALFGIGLTTRQAHFQMIGKILLSWLITLPCGALVSAVVYWLIRW